MILNIIDQIYSYSHFTTLLIGAIVFLVVLFIVVLYLGIKDAKKSKEPESPVQEEKDITFEELSEEQKETHEDVTFEMSTVTKNLEDFKKGLEEELAVEVKEKEEEPIVKKEEPLEIENVSEDYERKTIEDNFLDLIDAKNKEEDIEPINENGMIDEKEEDDIPITIEEAKEVPKIKEDVEIELPKKHDEVKENINNEERKKRERMLDDYLSATQALSLDAINEKLKEYEKDDF